MGWDKTLGDPADPSFSNHFGRTLGGGTATDRPIGRELSQYRFRSANGDRLLRGRVRRRPAPLGDACGRTSQCCSPRMRK